MSDLNLLSDLDIMALTVFGESRGEIADGKKAVAWVIRNRADHPRWWGHCLREVCLMPYQFSCWLPDDPNRPVLLDARTRTLAAYQATRLICEYVLKAPSFGDPTRGSDHYCTLDVVDKTRWAKGRKPECIIGHHAFFRIELPWSPEEAA